MEDGRYSPDDRGRCTSCGFLAVVVAHLPNIQAPLAGPAAERSSGNLWSALGGSDRPHCFVQAADLLHEIKESPRWGTGTDTPAVWGATIVVIERDRHCPSWFPWTPHVTPKEHWDRRNVLQLEASRHANDLAIATMQMDVQELRDDRSDRWSRIAVAIAVVSLVVALIATGAQVASLIVDPSGAAPATPSPAVVPSPP